MGNDFITKDELRAALTRVRDDAKRAIRGEEEDTAAAVLTAKIELCEEFASALGMTLDVWKSFRFGSA